MPKPILVALDSSERAVEVLAAATRLAAPTGRSLLILRVVGLPTEIPPEAYAMFPDDVVSTLRNRALAELAALSATVPGSRILVEVGSPWQSICRVAKVEDVELMVLGSHGYSGLDHVLGTTAAKVVNHADRSVLIVRGSDLLT